jgi:hypothetical protein
MCLRFQFEALDAQTGPKFDIPRTVDSLPSCLSWIFARVIPLRRFSRCVSSPSVLPHLWRDGASRFRTVRSRGCSHLSGFSHTPVPDILQSGPTMGFVSFQLVVDPTGDPAEAVPPLARDGLPRQRGSYPSKHSPRRQPYCITAAVALLTFPPLH